MAEAFTVMVLPFVVMVIQSALFDVVNVPSVVTVTFFDPPEASKVRSSGSPNPSWASRDTTISDMLRNLKRQRSA